jgi:ribosomal protein S18 acetylase RimI-like enzyme
MVAAMPALRPMREDDVPAVHAIAVRCFDDLADRLRLPRDPPHDTAIAHIRHRHVVATDAGGCWVAEQDGEVVGAAEAILREGLWGLSLLVVDPHVQSGGVGSALLRRAGEYGAGARGRIILSSQDPRALRAYRRLGLWPQPCLQASGTPRGVVAPATVRAGTRDDIPLTEAVDRAVRGAARGADIACLLDTGAELLVVPDRGYAVMRGNAGLRLLAATDDDAARGLLRAVLARVGGNEVAIEWLSERQRWALDVCLDAGLELRVEAGAVFTEGEIGPFRPYLPSGAFL